MIANAAFLSAVTLSLGGAWLAGELTFLTPYKATLFRRHGPVIGLSLLVVFFNLFGVYYSIARWLFLRDTGRKLLHLDRQLGTADGVLDDLGTPLEP